MENKVKRIFILGARGFIGKHLLKGFLLDSATIVIGYSSKECDLLSLNSINEALGGVTSDDIIIMVSTINRLSENNLDSLRKNIFMAENLCHFLTKHVVSQVIFFSTVDVYGLVPDSVKISEKLLPSPNDYYAISKLCSEFLLKKSLSPKNIDVTIFRLTGIYGPGDENKSTINALVNSAKNEGKIVIFGDGSNRRDFVHVEDVFKITSEAIRKKTNATVNIATGKSHSIKQIAEIITKQLDGAPQIEFKPSLSEVRAKHMEYDISLLKTFFPKTGFKNIKLGISQYLNHS
jgi:nucleoside-diphosphate-sugar epimerase